MLTPLRMRGFLVHAQHWRPGWMTAHWWQSALGIPTGTRADIRRDGACTAHAAWESRQQERASYTLRTGMSDL